MNDVTHNCDLFKFILFADETNLFYSHKNVNILFETINWLVASKPPVNIIKLILYL